MCYVGGPRCSKSAREALDRAMKNGSHSERMRAIEEYRHTPAGIAETRRTNPEYAAILQQERNAMLRARRVRDEQIERSATHLAHSAVDDNGTYFRKARGEGSIVDAHGMEMNGEEAPYPHGYPHNDVFFDDHFKDQMKAKGFEPRQIINAIKNPYKVTKVTAHPGQWRYCGDGVAVVMDKNRCVTVYLDGVKTPLRPDQMHDRRALNSRRVGIR